MDFLPGTDALIASTTLENQFYSIAITIQEIERNTALNPNGNINIMTATYDSDTGIFSGRCSIYAQINPLADGTHQIIYPNPYAAYTSWAEGTDGQGSATNINHALAQRAFWLAKYERNDAYNLTNTDPKFTGWSWGYLDDSLLLPTPHSARLEFSFEIELELISSSNGTQYQAQTYLSGTLPSL